MAVHTKLSKIDIRSLLLNYKIGNYLNHSEIVEGIENSNFFVQTDISKCVLTIFEKRVKSYDLPFFLQLMCHTQKKGIDCPVPITNRKGSQFGIINMHKYVFLIKFVQFWQFWAMAIVLFRFVLFLILWIEIENNINK